MEERDEALINELINRDQILRKYWEEHLELEKRVEEYNKRLYLTPEEELEKKRLKKKKLAGKDKIEAILAKYRKEIIGKK
ncbi:MAG: hypothetical protein AMJ45_01980 [Syntrophobacter sp. DG_60]|nr:MAG: hypothetical protein AMJ45_01980 [Syntrophobacter sp. DG_60]